MNIFNKSSRLSLWLTALLLTTLVAGCNDNDTSGPTGAIPTVTSVYPTNLLTAVPTNHKMTATFSAAMDAATITTLSFTVVGANEPALVGTVSLNAATNTASFVPGSALTDSTVYTATLTTVAKSTGGKALASNYVWTFTSGTAADTTAPAVSSTNPADADTDVALNNNITATFAETLNTATVTATSFTLTADTGATVVSGVVTYDNMVAIFNPDSNLLENTLYTATLTTAITDLAATANALTANVVWSFATGTTVATGPTAINLRTAGNFAILTGTGVTSADGSAVITGNIGASGITGASITVDCTELATGEVFTDDANYPGFTCTAVNKTAAAIALLDMGTAYNNASVPVTPAGVGPFLELGAGTVTAQTLVPGVYTWAGNVNITGDITLNGSATDVWIFQIDGTLDTANSIILAGGALAKNVYWRVADVVTLQGTSQFTGVILAKTNITMITGATVAGRLLAQTDVNLGSITVVTQPAP
jgi:hypothetical protein